MKQFLWWLVLNGGFAAGVWFGFVENIEGAQYLVKFWVWAIALPAGLLLLFSGEESAQKAAAIPPRPVATAMSLALAWAALGVFVWHGHAATAVAWSVWMVGCATLRVKARDLKAA
jgi:hypothetical protein